MVCELATKKDDNEHLCLALVRTVHGKIKTSEQRAAWLLDKGIRVLARWLDNTSYGREYTKEVPPASDKGRYLYPAWRKVGSYPKWKEEHAEVHSGGK